MIRISLENDVWYMARISTESENSFKEVGNYSYFGLLDMAS